MSAADVSLPGFNVVSDVHGDLGGVPLSFAGNQWFVVDEVLRLLSERGVRAFIETIPPGLVRMRALGSPLRVGNILITARPYVVSLPPKMLEGLPVEDSFEYVENDIVLAYVSELNDVRSWCDLASLDSIAIPNPITEGIGAQLRDTIMERCGNYDSLASRALITKVHHREIPAALQAGMIRAGVMWASEARYWGFRYLEPEPRISGRLAFALLRGADEGSRRAYEALKSLRGELRQLYERYGFKFLS